MYKIGDEILLYGRPAFIFSRRMHSISERPGAYYDLKRDFSSRKVDFWNIHEDKILPVVKQAVVSVKGDKRPRLVK